jgi:hypothetical protein
VPDASSTAPQRRDHVHDRHIPRHAGPHARHGFPLQLDREPAAALLDHRRELRLEPRARRPRAFGRAVGARQRVPRAEADERAHRRFDARGVDLGDRFGDHVVDRARRGGGWIRLRL